jgi:3D (Asp-Asp-Asp) domain-containing protein
MRRLLLGAALLAAPLLGPAGTRPAVQAETETVAALRVRLTWFGFESCVAWPCRFASGTRVEQVAEGSVAAASWWLFPFGTLLELPTGRQVVVLDRGGGINREAWVDVWCGHDAACQQEMAELGPYTTVSVLRWGW